MHLQKVWVFNNDIKHKYRRKQRTDVTFMVKIILLLPYVYEISITFQKSEWITITTLIE